MLDADTKRRIDTARDILVGKVPDPKGQVEQITIALIYKFMDDIDAESEEWGGDREFFAGDFSRYGWAKLMGPGMGGHETLNLYAEAIARMPENPGIPPLFRDIFNNAYLPYRDPETLRAFLKIIDDFSYDHSERLGDAFEYLLSVLGSQGDAGQFRTPRHIIDFMVAVIDPKKDDVVLDPACGTAGFLISSYKHIMAANSGEDGHNALTPDERARLADSFRGYDISPDMVRLSLVNMYLHGFAAPHIFEYDTLTSEDRWNEYADVILANPPFMSPKGGIRPHNRFSVNSKRSEVLFVDYMAEHLTAHGRAGVIVPEGIIFQSQTAYRQLRKMLVEDYLVAVVSLPAGVFNPYSGVKTSVLFLDRALAKRTDAIGFFKVENDGFDLGAQRRPIERNDLPRVQAELGAFLSRLQAGDTVDGVRFLAGRVVAKEIMARDREYNLTGGRYQETPLHSTEYPLRRIGELVKSISPPVKLQTPAFGKIGRFPIIDQSQTEIAGWTNDESTLVTPDGPVVIFGDHTCTVKLVEVPFAQGADGIKILQTNVDLNPRFLYFLLRARPLPNDGYKRHFSDLKEYHLPLPPLDVQREVVEEIEGYHKVIDGARAVIENYRPHINIDPNWPVEPINTVASVESGFGFPLAHQGLTTEEVPFLKVSDMNLPGNEMQIVSWNNSVSLDVLKKLKAKAFPAGTVIFPKIGAAIATNKKRVLTRESTYDNNVMGILPNSEKLLPRFLHGWLMGFDLSHWASDAQPPSMRKTVVEQYSIPLPPLAVQLEIIAELAAEQSIVDANRELIERFENKIQAAVARVWGNGSPMDTGA